MEKLLKILKNHGVNVIHHGLNTFTVDNVFYNTEKKEFEVNRFIVRGFEIIEDVKNGLRYKNVWDFLGY